MTLTTLEILEFCKIPRTTAEISALEHAGYSGNLCRHSLLSRTYRRMERLEKSGRVKKTISDHNAWWEVVE